MTKLTHGGFRDVLEVILNSSTDQHIRDKIIHILSMFDKIPDIGAELENWLNEEHNYFKGKTCCEGLVNRIKNKIKEIQNVR